MLGENDYFKNNLQNPETLEYDKDNEDKFKDENMYKYHENTLEFDPSTQPFSFFYLYVQGQIESGDFPELDGLALKYEFVHGTDWNISSGDKSGAGQRSFKSSYLTTAVKPMNWNLPFEVAYRSMNPQGWP